MKKQINVYTVLLTAILVFYGVSIHAQNTPFYIDEWGSLNRHGWHIVPDSEPGNAGMGGTGTTPDGAWATLRGGFNPLKATINEAVVVTGKVEFVDGGPTSWSALRFGIFRHDSAGTLQYAGTDSARWGTIHYPGTDTARFVNGLENNAYGYMIIPHSGTNDQVSGNGGNGTQWSVNGGSWLSTFGGGTYTMGITNQSPARAEMNAGIYDWAFSVRPLGDGTNEIKWYLVDEDYRYYWFGGIEIDTSSFASDTYNGIIFGINPSNDIGTTGITGLNLTDVKVYLGQLPDPVWNPHFYINEWGIIGNKTGGWNFIPAGIMGNAGIGGSLPNTDWAAIRGGFNYNIWKFRPAYTTILVEGKLEFTGGGFEGPGSLRLGIFFSENDGILEFPETDSAQWTGSDDNHYGYLFIPHSGSNEMMTWNGVPGTIGAVVNGTWFDTEGSNNYVLSDVLQSPSGAIAGAGIYDFRISIEYLSTLNYKITINLNKEGYTFSGSVVDEHHPLLTEMFNGVAFALNSWSGSTTTSMKVIDVKTTFDPIVSIDDGEPVQPSHYVLYQNYPNPFNPSTKIIYSISKAGYASLKVYNLLGEEVATLVEGVQQAGNYITSFDGSDLATGVYLYQLKASDFLETKKLILLK